MRASTLVGIAVALFLGAATVVVIRYFRLFERDTPVPVKTEPLMVLVAKTNLFEGTTATIIDVTVREATEAEKQEVLSNPKDYFPARPEAAQMRVANRNIPSGQLLKREYFQDLALPKSVSENLAPGMRSVNVLVPKERAAGGLIRVGEYVDVYLTAAICNDPKCSSYRSATAPLAKNLKVIVKRDTPWVVMERDPEGKPVSFILEANAYRAGLIELAKTKGIISLMPSLPNTIDKMSPAAAKLEETKAAAFLTGQSVVSDKDLEEIFKVQPQSVEPPLAIEHYSGLKYVGTTIHNPDSGRTIGEGRRGYSFHPPGTLGAAATPDSALRFASGTDGGCVNCGAGSKR